MLQTSVQTTSESRPAATAELLPIAKSSVEACCPECGRRALLLSAATPSLTAP